MLVRAPIGCARDGRGRRAGRRFIPSPFVCAAFASSLEVIPSPREGEVVVNEETVGVLDDGRCAIRSRREVIELAEAEGENECGGWRSLSSRFRGSSSVQGKKTTDPFGLRLA